MNRRSLWCVLLVVALHGGSRSAEIPLPQLPVRWDLEALSRPPEAFPAPGLEAPGVRSLFFAGLPWEGRPTRVFAWYGTPDRPSAERAPAMVLVHGGGGTAFDEWVRLWNGRGYAAIAMDLCGSIPGGTHGARPRHEWGGPPGWGGFDQVGRAVEDQWAYHAVADIALAHSLVRSFPEVDPDRVGMTGISWGGYLVCLASAVDPRFRFAVPVYGCGFLGDDSAWVDVLAGMGDDASRRWLTLWDPSRYLPAARVPFLWVTGTNDFAYPLSSLRRSYRLPPGERTLCVRVRMAHAHGGPGEKPEEIHAFANAHLKGGRSLLRVTGQGLAGLRAWATYEHDAPLARAELNFTRGSGPWKDREWLTAPATVVAERSAVEAEVPEDATAFYLNLIDDRGLVVSTEHAERPPRWRERLLAALEPLDAQYDPSESMLRQPFSSPGYHTTLRGGPVHPTRSALDYALALLDTGDAARRDRAVAVLRRVVALQDKDPASQTYGIWSWFLEEPLGAMSPPDWNWADFCGARLLQVFRDHAWSLPEDLRREVREAIVHAARSIQRRNVGPGYTNIAIMGTHVSLVAAESLGIPDLKDYAMARLARLHEHTMRTGAFTEYNSPTYTVVALEELGRMRAQVRDSRALRLVEDIYRLAWEEIAHHFHPPTRQWAGPHSRAYRTLLGDGVLGLIRRATDGRVDLGADPPSLVAHRLPLPCPKDLERFFTDLPEARELVKTFVGGDRPIVGTTYLHPAFTLGSVNRGDLWNQRRAVLAYWGDAASPSYLHLRCLHDGYDYAAAQVFSAQEAGDLVAAVNFATDGGDRHVSLDRIRDGKIRARDLRLRFELGGAAGASRPKAPASLAEAASLALDRVSLRIAVPYAALGDAVGRWEAGGADGKAWLDVLLLDGEEREVDWAALERAAVGLAIRLTAGDAPLLEARARVEDGTLRIDAGKLGVAVPVRPGRAEDLQTVARWSGSRAGPDPSAPRAPEGR